MQCTPVKSPMINECQGYLAMVFTRNPLGQVPGGRNLELSTLLFNVDYSIVRIPRGPHTCLNGIASNTWCIQKIPSVVYNSMMSPGQSYALPVILWVKSAELLIGRSPRQPGELPKEDVSKMPPCCEDWKFDTSKKIWKGFMHDSYIHIYIYIFISFPQILEVIHFVSRASRKRSGSARCYAHIWPPCRRCNASRREEATWGPGRSVETQRWVSPQVAVPLLKIKHVTLEDHVFPMVLFLWVCFLDFLDAFFRYGSKNAPDLCGVQSCTIHMFATVKSWNVTPSAAVHIA